MKTSAILPLLLAGVAACGGGRRAVDADAPPPRAAERRSSPPPAPDPVRAYRGAGLIAHGGAFPVTGRVSFVGGPTPDTTFVLLTLALPSRALSFTHSDDSYRAEYEVRAAVRRGADTAASVEAVERVVVPNFRETARTDESIVFQQLLRLAPGDYDLRLQLRDLGSDRAVVDSSALRVPRLADGSLGTPIPYYEAIVRRTREAVPRLLVTPRATVTFGQDSVLPVYVEGYGAADEQRVRAEVRGEAGSVLWRDSLALERREGALASGVVELPVARLGIGAVTLAMWRPGATDTVRSPLFVSFGDDLPAATFEDMVSYLRFFTSPHRLDLLRRAPVSERGAAWAEFLAATDPDPVTEGHQALQAYFVRLQVANQRYRDEGGPGWLSDRGMVFTAFGDPDQVFEPSVNHIGARNRMQVWIYRDHQLQVEFRDASGFDRWRMTPSSETRFRMALSRLHQ
ncbi:MAG TPA: GWxTD domain-containing protein [Gemmatimonadales bacterium]